MRLHYLNWAFFWFLVFLTFLFVSLFAGSELVGTKYQFFGPGSQWWASSKMSSGLKSCPPDHVRILWFPEYSFTKDRFNDEEIREFDLSGSTITYAGMEEESGWFEWASARSVNHDGRNKLTPTQLAKVEKIIDSMPASTSNGPIEGSVSVAINRQGKLQIYHYQFDADVNFKSLPAPIADLCLGGTLFESSQ